MHNLFYFLTCLEKFAFNKKFIELYLQDIEVGKAVRPQLAMRVADATTAWKKV